ncbi:MAG: class II aldolase/adducin family protein [Clostridiales bacterium]|nr:class II aldolase/adducin family protein [Candidatus Cacconaster stercorequi]
MAYTEQQARELVIEAGHRLLANQLIARTWGNISARISDTQFIITPSGRAYDTLQPQDLVKVTISDGSYEGTYKPSSEVGVHIAAYQLRANVNFIIHTHQFFASAVCAEGEDTSFAPCAAYALPGSKKLKNAVAQTVRDHPTHNAFLMARHGALCLGSSFDDAFATAEELEAQCQQLFRQRVSIIEQPLAGKFDVDAIKGLPFVRWENDPYTAAYSRLGQPLRAYIDDFAQLVGYTAPVAAAKPRTAGHALMHRCAVLLQNFGALCSADNAADALAVSMILRKNCAAALYVQHGRPLSFVDATIQRTFYLKKYAKRKDA